MLPHPPPRPPQRPPLRPPRHRNAHRQVRLRVKSWPGGPDALYPLGDDRLLRGPAMLRVATAAQLSAFGLLSRAAKGVAAGRPSALLLARTTPRVCGVERGDVVRVVLTASREGSVPVDAVTVALRKLGVAQVAVERVVPEGDRAPLRLPEVGKAADPTEALGHYLAAVCTGHAGRGA